MHGRAIQLGEMQSTTEPTETEARQGTEERWSTLRETRLCADGIFLQRRRRLPKLHLTAQIFKVWLHPQGHAEIVCEEVLGWHLY